MPKCFDRGKCEIEEKKSFNVNAKLRLFDMLYLIHYNLRPKALRASQKRFSNLFARVVSWSSNTLRETTFKKGLVMDVEDIEPSSVSR